MDRKVLGVVGLLALVATSGCLGFFGGGGISDEQLCEGASYDFDTEANATYTVSANNTYQAVYQLENRSEMRLFYRDGLGNKQPLEIAAVKFRAANGTVYDCEDIDVTKEGQETVVTMPADNGTFAYRVDSNPKRFNTRTFVEGSHQVVLPADREVRNPIFGQVRPGADQRTETDGRITLTWDNPDANRILIQYYLERDVLVLLGLIGIVGVAAGAGILYYYRQMRDLREIREEAGLDVDIEDDDDSPPGPP